MAQESKSVETITKEKTEDAPNVNAPNVVAPNVVAPKADTAALITAKLDDLIKEFNIIIYFNDEYDIIDDTNGIDYRFNLCYMLINNIEITDIDIHKFNINGKFNFFCIEHKAHILDFVLSEIYTLHKPTYTLFDNIIKSYNLSKKSEHNSIIVKLILCFYLYSDKSEVDYAFIKSIIRPVVGSIIDAPVEAP